MSNNRTTSGYLSNSDLARTVATTASVIVNSTTSGKGLNQAHKSLMSNDTYKKALNMTISSDKGKAVIKDRQENPNKFISLIRKSKQEKLKKKKTKKDFNILSTDLLNEIPDQTPASPTEEGDNTADGTVSLFQGFSATLPEIDENLERFKKNPNNSKLLTLNWDEDRNPLPGNITAEKIRLSQNPKHLKHYKSEINYKLDLIEVRKGLSSNEIHEIDQKIEKLYNLRKTIFDRIAKFEQDESYLEDQLLEVESRLQIVKDVEVETSSSEDDDNKAILMKKNEQAVAEDESEDDEDYINVEAEYDSDYDEQNALLSKSIHSKLANTINKTKKRVSSRRHKPTLQQYYKPGDRINEFHAHEDSITALAFDAPFGTLVTSSLDNTVRVWDMNRYKCSGLLEGHYSMVRCMEMHDHLLVTGSQDATLKLWDLTKVGHSFDGEDTSPLLSTFESHVEEITALSFNSNTLVSGSSDKTIRQWDLNTGHCMQTIDILWASSMMNSHIGSIGDFGSASTWSSIPTSSEYPFIGALQSYDAALASGTADGIVRLWDLRSGEVIRQLIGHTGPVTCLQFDDRNLTSGSADRSIRIWDLRTGGIIDSFAYDSPISTLQFDQTKIITTNQENTAKVYDRITEKHWTIGNGVEDPENKKIINCARYQEGYLVEGGSNGSVGVWSI